MNAISFMTANLVARETGWAMRDWGHGDRATNDAFRPLETYPERIDQLLGDIAALGFDSVDLWGAHVGSDWATDEHLAAARESLARHRLHVSTYATWVDPLNVERACQLARSLGTRIIGGGFTGDARELAPVLRGHGVVLAVENHAERTPTELLAKVEAGRETMRATVDTGWWATQGYDPARAIEELAGQVAHVHLKDVRHEGEPHETCAWGEGIVDVEACLGALRRIDYTGAYTVEHEPEDRDPSEDCRAMRTQLLDWLR